MTKILVIGGTGYTGANIVQQAVNREFEVTSISRTIPQQKIEGVQYTAVSVSDISTHESLVQSADIIVGALAPREELESQLLAIYTNIATLAAEYGKRFIVIGGFSALRPAEGAPRFAEGNDIPLQYAAEARVMYHVLTYLETDAPENLDWLYVSPAATYGAHSPGEAKSEYRVGGQVALFDQEGVSAISGSDFALAIVDEVVKSEHSNEQIAIAY